MSESMARKVRRLEEMVAFEREGRAVEQRRIRKLENALEKLLWRLNKEGDGPLPEEALDAERILKNG
jgi:hypothetical protein